MPSSVRRLLFIGSLVVLPHRSLAAQEAPRLGAAASFAVLGGSAVTSNQASRIIGNVGVSPGSTITGIAPEDVSIGRIDRNGVAAREAQKDAAAAYGDLERRPCAEHVVFGETALPGRVYCFDANARLTGTLTLEGDRDAVWIFQVHGALTVDPRASVVVIGGGTDANVFWQVGDSATIGEDISFRGTILARTDITLKRGASLSGRALALTGRVTLDGNDVSLCCEPIDVTPETLSNGIVGTAYRQTLAAQGGSGSYTFSTVGRPEWLQLDDAVLSGMPLFGTFTFTVIATDNLTHCSGRRTYTIQIAANCGGLAILTESLPAAAVGTEYDASPIGVGGATGKYTVEASGNVPPGLSTSLQGTPTTAGFYCFRVTVTDEAGCSAFRVYCVAVQCPSIIFSPLVLPDATVGKFYDHTLTPIGGTPPYTFTVVPSPLPNNFKARPPTGLTEQIFGTPAAPGIVNFIITATDQYGCSGSQTYTFHVHAAKTSTDVPTLSSSALLFLTLLLATTAVFALGRLR